MNVISWRPCGVCGGSGDVSELVNPRTFSLDFLDGLPTGRKLTCDYCDGRGKEPDEIAMKPEEDAP